MLITPCECLFANMSYGPRHVAVWPGSGLMLSRPTLLCISEIILSRNSCSGGEMTRRQADESRGCAEDGGRLQHEPATNSRDIKWFSFRIFRKLNLLLKLLTFWNFYQLSRTDKLFLIWFPRQIIYWAITSWNKTKMLSRTRLSVFYPHYLYHLCEQ